MTEIYNKENEKAYSKKSGSLLRTGKIHLENFCF